MTQFKIDTSGAVEVTHPNGLRTNYHWPHLSPFVQGAEGEARRELAERLMREGMTAAEALYATAFSRWHPSALQRIMADCERCERLIAHRWIASAKRAGQQFWESRQRGGWGKDNFPPQTISLAEDGLIHLSGVG